MDDKLIQRFHDGEASAAPALRNQLRAIAARVLSAPQWELRNHDERERLEREVAAEAMESRHENAVGYALAAMSGASVRGLRKLRRRDGMHDDDHPLPERIQQTFSGRIALGLDPLT